MKTAIRSSMTVVCGRVAAVVLAGVLASGSFSTFAQAQAVAAQAPVDAKDSKVQAQVLKQLNDKRFSDVKVVVQNGVVSLHGTVASIKDKDEADAKAHRPGGVQDVRNVILISAGGGGGAL